MEIRSIHLNYFIALLLVGSSFILYGCQSNTPYQEIDRGVVVPIHKKDSKTKKVRLEVITDHIIRVTASPGDHFKRPKSLMRVEDDLPTVSWNVHKREDSLILATSALKAFISLKTGQVKFKDTSGRLVLAERPKGRSFVPDTVEGVPAYHVQQLWENKEQHPVYGLGGNQLGFTNIRGRDMTMAQRNSEVYVPFILSPEGAKDKKAYGLLWDNNSLTKYGNPQPYLPLDSLQLYDESGKAGGLTAVYSPDGATPLLGKRNENRQKTFQKVEREEQSIDYPFLKDQKKFPKKVNLALPTAVRWEGDFSSSYSGKHTFQLHWGGYVKIWIDHQRVFPAATFPSGLQKRQGWAWRQCWNPADKVFDVSLKKGKKYHLKVQWIPDGGESFISLKWKKPKTEEQKNQTSLASEMGQNIDYYFISGENMDSVISGYRTLTGKAPIMPKWAYGYWQSREHYESQKQILQVVQKFRQKKFPLDNIVQDWFYWKEDQWGSQQFDSLRYPDPKGMIDTLHKKYHTHFMISVWPKFYIGTKAFKKFWDKGWLYKKSVEDSTKDWVGKGYVSTFYDAFNEDARKAFWQLVDTNLFKIGVDAWWMDASEPDIVSNTSIETRKELMDPTALGPSSEYFNAYPLENEKTFYKGQRREQPDQRVFILTRSAFAGSQRFAAATWSGDIGATWWDMRNQIATGISFSMSGIPYWTMDIGGFSAETRYHHPNPTNRKEWQEQFTRWYQFGAFCPLFRAHGQPPEREPFNVAPEGSPAYKSMLYYDKLRYRLMPYIYSLAGAVYLDDYTIMRGLGMDFPQDSMANNITDEYLFGPDLLINPVYKYKARNRQVYLPDEKTKWYNLYSGKSFSGGQTITADAPYERMPVFVRAGAILPFGPALQYTGEKKADTMTLYVYTGKDGEFDLYEDNGRTYDYEKGAYSVIPLTYHESSQTLTIGKRKGGFKGMLKERVFQIKWMSPEHPAHLQFNIQPDKTVKYNGEAVSLKLNK